MFKLIFLNFLIVTLLQSSENNYYKEYIEYLMNNKKIISIKNIEDTLNNDNSFLTYNEAVLKLIYDFYYENKYDKYDKYLTKLILKTSKDKIINSYEGFLIENILLKNNDTNIELISDYYCLYLFKNTNNIKKCINNKLIFSKKNNNFLRIEQLNLLKSSCKNN